MMLLVYDVHEKKLISYRYNDEGKLVERKEYNGVEALILNNVERAVYKPGIEYKLLTIVVESKPCIRLQEGMAVIRGGINDCST